VETSFQKLHILKTFRSGAKNVIIFIGDGMGIAPTVAARIYKVINIIL